MSDPYPEVTVDESGIVPPQSGRNPDWPKKIRTLTASELDRLTIDSTGRFYWDGKLVNYEPPQQPKSSDSEDRHPEAVDRNALDILDRAAYDLGEQRTPEPIEGAELAKPHDVPAIEPRRARGDDPGAVDLDHVEPVAAAAPQVAVGDARLAGDLAMTPMIRVPERVRVSLSSWQSLGAIIVVLGIAVGASGLAAYGLVAAHDWGCRTGLIQNYCPMGPAARPNRSDIPA
jgi:hypothetical protein